VEYLKGVISRGTSSSTHHASLASCYQRLGEYGKALEHAKLAVEADTGDSDVKWMHEVLSRQKMAVDLFPSVTCHETFHVTYISENGSPRKSVTFSG